MAGGKKKKASKRKNHKNQNQQQQQQPPPDSPPNSNPSTPPHENDGKEKIEEEAFETPRMQPETPGFPPETPYYSMENLKVPGRRDEFVTDFDLAEKLEGLDLEVDCVEGEGSAKEKELDEEKESEELERSDELEVDKLNETKLESSDRLEETKLDEFSVEWLEKEKVEECGGVDEKSTDASTEVVDVSLCDEKGPNEEVVDFNGDKKEMKLDKSSVEKLEDELVEESLLVDNEISPDGLIELADVSSSNKKGMKVVPWPEEEVVDVDGDLDGDVVEVVSSEKGGVDYETGALSKEVQQYKSALVEKIDSLGGGKNGQPIPVTEISEDVTESVQEIVPKIDLDLTSTNKFEKPIEKSSLPAGNSVPSTEEASGTNKVSIENSLASVVSRDVSTNGRVKENLEPSLNAEQIEISQRKEVARGPPAVRRATLWNCCGLFEVLTSPDR